MSPSSPLQRDARQLVEAEAGAVVGVFSVVTVGSPLGSAAAALEQAAGRAGLARQLGARSVSPSACRGSSGRCRCARQDDLAAGWLQPHDRSPRWRPATRYSSIWRSISLRRGRPWTTSGSYGREAVLDGRDVRDRAAHADERVGPRPAVEPCQVGRDRLAAAASPTSDRRPASPNAPCSDRADVDAEPLVDGPTRGRT